MATLSLTLGILGLFTCGLLVVGALVGLSLGIVAALRAKRSPEVYGGKRRALAGIALNCLALAVAFFYIRSLYPKPGFANEAASIGDLRTLMAAETAYRDANRGFYDTPQCLVAPSGCIPGYTGPPFADESLAAPRKAGYDRTFHPGPAAANRPAGASPSSLQSFAFVLVPFTPGKTGTRGFCGDSSGRICSTRDGSAPPLTQGLCSSECKSLF